MIKTERQAKPCFTCGKWESEHPGGAFCKQSTPELDKLHAVHERSQACGEFIGWLSSNGIVLASYHEHGADCYAKDDNEDGYDYGDQICDMSTEVLRHEHRSVTNLLAEFFEIDLDKVEAEKRALLDRERSDNTARAIIDGGVL